MPQHFENLGSYLYKKNLGQKFMPKHNIVLDFSSSLICILFINIISFIYLFIFVCILLVSWTFDQLVTKLPNRQTVNGNNQLKFLEFNKSNAS